MKNLARRGVVLLVALSLTASPLMAVTAEAGRGNGKSRGNRGRQSTQRVYRSDRDYRGDRNYGDRTQYRTRTQYRDRYVSRYSDRHYYSGHHHGTSGIGPFLGGLAVGAIIGSQVNSCPPRHVVRRVYVYDCDVCDSYYRGYDAWCDHLVIHHHVPACEVRDYYPEYSGGYWEEY